MRAEREEPCPTHFRNRAFALGAHRLYPSAGRSREHRARRLTGTIAISASGKAWLALYVAEPEEAARGAAGTSSHRAKGHRGCPLACGRARWWRGGGRDGERLPPPTIAA